MNWTDPEIELRTMALGLGVSSAAWDHVAKLAQTLHADGVYVGPLPGGAQAKFHVMGCVIEHAVDDEMMRMTDPELDKLALAWLRDIREKLLKFDAAAKQLNDPEMRMH